MLAIFGLNWSSMDQNMNQKASCQIQWKHQIYSSGGKVVRNTLTQIDGSMNGWMDG